MNKIRRNVCRALPLSAIGLLATSIAGCHDAVSPFVDELDAFPAVTSPSSEAAMAAKVDRSPVVRGFSAVEVRVADGNVFHAPLYFEDGAESLVETDDRFAWSGDDYAAWLFGSARFLGNMALIPVSAIATNPWTVMESDGVASRDVLLAKNLDAAVASAHP